MVRPQVTVNITGTGSLPAASIPTDTGVFFLAFAGTGGPAVPTSVTSAAEAIDAGVPDAIAAYIDDAMAQGAAEAYIVRATAADAEAVTVDEWKAALALLTPSFGPGQVLIPGVSTEAAHSALLDHVHANAQRIALLDVAATGTATDIATAIAAIQSTQGADRAGVFGPWVTLPGTGGDRSVPASIIAAGLAARGDAATGNANHAPIFDQGRGAGTVAGATGVATTFTDAETDTLYDAGVNVFRNVNGVITLTGWKSAGLNPAWRQLNVARLAMQVAAQVGADMFEYLGAPIDGQGILLSQIEGQITGRLLDLYNANALYGADADAAYTVVCDFANNTAETIALGQIHADVAITASTHAEQITINIVTSLAS